MSALTKAALVAAASFVCGLVGFALQAVLPAQTMTDAHGMVGAISGLVSLLLALVLGLVIWTSHGVYTSQVSQALALGPIVLQLDHAFEQLGPKGIEGRALLKSQVLSHRERFWGEGRFTRSATSHLVAKEDAHVMAGVLSRVGPTDDRERGLVASAQQAYASMNQTQLLMARQLATPLSPILLVVVIGWSLLLFLTYGLSAPLNIVTAAMAGLGSIAVASAFLLILELTDPYDGLFRISPAGINNVLAAIGVDDLAAV
jgi:hypothetical protein